MCSGALVEGRLLTIGLLLFSLGATKVLVEREQAPNGLKKEKVVVCVCDCSTTTAAEHEETIS